MSHSFRVLVSVAFRFIAANQHPDHDPIAVFRRRFLKQIGTVFVQVLMLARQMGVLISARWWFIAMVLAAGEMMAAPTPRSGQMAPNR